MNSLELINLLQNHFASYKLKELKASGLISPTFPNTFNPSAAHGVVHRIINTKSILESVKRYWVAERCIRQVDIPRIGDGTHLCLFEMIAGVIESPGPSAPIEQVINQTFQLISNCLQLSKDRLAVTCFGGANIGGTIFEPDLISFDVWRALGIETVFSIPGRSNFIYLESEDEAAGPRCEIYYKLQNSHRPIHFVEIGSIIFETHRFHRGRPIKARNTASGFAFGLERLLMVLNGYDSIYDSDLFKPLIDLLINLLPNKIYAEVFQERVFTTVDVFKALNFILADILASYPISISSQQKQLFLRLLHIAREGIVSLQLSPEVLLHKFSDKLMQMYGYRYPHLEINAKNTVSVLNELIEQPNKEVLESLLNGNKKLYRYSRSL